jgi:putative hydrolase of the HAD superfamily
VTHAVVFDLWDTIVRFDPAASRAFSDLVAERLDRDPDAFDEVWREGREQRDSGPLADYLRSIDVDEALVGELVEARRSWARDALVPQPGVLETLAELRSRGLRTGLLSVCSDDVPAAWPETRFHGLFDAEVFSCSVGLRKPDPRIYRLTCDRLGVDPSEAMFVGDGANDELAGAERVGMRSVLIHRAGEEPFWPEARKWSGPRITEVPQVLDLL